YAEGSALFRKRAVDEFAAAIRKSLDRPRIDAQGFVKLEQANSILSAKDPELASKLQNEIALRKEEWQTVFEVAAPFDASISEQVTAVTRAANGAFVEQVDVQGQTSRPTVKLAAGNTAEIQAT